MTTTKIETLTEEERAFIASLPEHLGGMQLRKALRVIETMTDRDVGARCAACDQRLDASSDRDSYHSALLAAPNAADARVRELEAEVQRLKERNAQLVVSSQVRSYEAALDAQERAEKALFQLRERVARAIMMDAQGLHVVTAADKAVLDAADAWLDEGTCAIRALADAVRARRGVK